MDIEENRVFCYIKDFTLLNNNQTSTLTIRVLSDGLSIFVKDEKSCKINYATKYDWVNNSDSKSLKSYLSDILSLDLVLKGEYKKSTILLPSISYTLVPKEFFIQEEAKTYLKYHLNEQELNNCNIIISNFDDFVGVFAIENEIFNIAQELFPKCEIDSYSSAFLSLAHKQNFTYSKNQVSILIDNNFFDIAVYNYKNLLLFNRFEYSTKEDLTYFILKVLKELDIDANETNATIHGNVKTDFIELLEHYIAYVQVPLQEPDSDYSWDLYRYFIEQKL